jgi:hypothetical protein
MRTTVTLDPDVEKLIRRAMRESGEPFKQVLNRAVRNGLPPIPPRKSKKSAKRFRLPTFHMGKPLVDLTKALKLAGDLEDEEIIAKMRAGK